MQHGLEPTRQLVNPSGFDIRVMGLEMSSALISVDHEPVLIKLDSATSCQIRR